MRIVIDQAKCSGYGTCAEVCGEVFKLDEWGYAYVTDDEGLIAQHTDGVRQAAKECPAAAIVLHE